jgi:hypothetical protein
LQELALFGGQAKLKVVRSALHRGEKRSRESWEWRHSEPANPARVNHPHSAIMKIKPTETQLTGKSLLRDGRVVGDETCQRIRELITSHLKELGRDPSGWDALYLDPDDGRLWELTYPQSHLQGGGPQQLRYLTSDEAKKKYDAVAVFRPPVR